MIVRLGREKTQQEGAEPRPPKGGPSRPDQGILGRAGPVMIAMSARSPPPSRPALS